MYVLKGLVALRHHFARHPIARDRQAAAWTRFLSWQFKSRLRHEVIVPWIGGISLAAQRGMRGATGNIYTGLDEYADMLFLLHFLRPGDLFFDVGANVGSYTLLASGVCKAETIAFEPDPETIARLKRNVALNKLENIVQIQECALGSVEGMTKFTKGLDTVNRIASAMDTNVREVRICRLDSFGSTRCPNFMKIDVEGHEEGVIKGATRLLADQNLKAVELESVSAPITETFSKYGFARRYYDPRTRTLSTDDNGLRAVNALFVRDETMVKQRLTSAPSISVLGQKI